MVNRSYHDFDMAIMDRGDGRYDVRVLDSPSGQARCEFTLPFSDLELENFLLRIGRSRRGVRRLESPEAQAARTFGERLSKAIFAGDVGVAWQRSIDDAERDGKGLRLRLRLTDAEVLAEVPWEFLCVPSSKRHLVLSSWTPLVRYLDLPRSPRPLTVTPPLRMLAMVSSPSDYPALDTDSEWSKLDESLEPLESAGLLEITRVDRATLRELQRTLRRTDFHVFHFIGHGGFDEQASEGILVLEDEQGRSRPVTGHELGTILTDARSIRLAVLNSCEGARAGGADPFGGTAPTLVRGGIPAVIAMQFEITDRAAIVFAHELYAAISDGYPVDAAVAEARRAIFGAGNDVEWGTPVLYMRTDDGRLFDFVPGAQSAPTKHRPEAEATPEVVETTPLLTGATVEEMETAPPELQTSREEAGTASEETETASPELETARDEIETAPEEIETGWPLAAAEPPENSASKTPADSIPPVDEPPERPPTEPARPGPVDLRDAADSEVDVRDGDSTMVEPVTEAPVEALAEASMTEPTASSVAVDPAETSLTVELDDFEVEAAALPSTDEAESPIADVSSAAEAITMEESAMAPGAAEPLHEPRPTSPAPTVDPPPTSTNRRMFAVGTVAAAIVLVGAIQFVTRPLDQETTTTAVATTAGATTVATVAPVLDAGTVVAVPAPAITIDGDLSDWASVPVATVGQHRIAGQTAGGRLGTDSTGEFRVAFDDAGLYLAAAVTDDIYSQMNVSDQIWRGDAIDLNLSTVSPERASAIPDADDFQITITPANADGVAAHALFQGEGASTFVSAVTDTDIVSAGVVSSSGSYTVEAFVPWSVLGLDGIPDSDLTALFAVFDNDGETDGGKPLQTAVLAHLDGVGFQDPDTWGRLTFQR